MTSVGPQGGEGDGTRLTWWSVVAGVLLVLAGAVALWTLADGDGELVSVSPPGPAATEQPTPTTGPAPTPTLSPPTPSPAPAPTPSVAPQPIPADPTPQLSGATYGPFSGSPEAATLEGSWIADVRSAGHAGYDRVVIEFDGDVVPQYSVGYTATSGPFYDVPGEVVPVEGTAFLDIWLQGTSRFDMTDSYEPVYTGPERVRSDTLVVTEVVEVEDFEANVHWIVGLDERSRFVVWTLDSPHRLVVDVEH